MSRHKCNIGWGFLPLLFAATAILTFLVCYLIAVSLDHVIPFVPYISDTGAYPPESCLFSQFLNVAAALGILAVYIRWKSLKKLSVENVKRFSCLNTSSFVIGVLAAIGLSVVGNFQWTSQFEIHIIGAGMAFGLGLVYCWMQSHLTYKLHPRYNSLWIARLRVILALMVTLSLISMLAGSLAMNFVGGEEDGSAIGSGDKEYAIDPEISWAYLMTTISEWALAVLLLAWFGTFCVEYTDVWLKTKIGKRSEKPLEEDENVNVIVDDGKSKDTKF
ncbi:DNA damage-regulated autophagy modulator protein 2-like isoform X1 [Ptychodera flava]|uniref:DNA damage-regulated autophagy modulator protein 2-like isoform X1 n=1 Tax=Ptychodera flava TaxID=63121 RepID=UPI003969FA88